MTHHRRRGFTLQASLHVPLPRAEVFDFFSDAFRLEQITPPWLAFSVLTPAPVRMACGTLIDYRLKLRGVPFRWRTEITRWEPADSFQDSQVRGPFHYWIHTHTFEDCQGGTRVGDRVDYAVPGGALLHRWFVRGELQRIFEYRQRQLPRLLGVPAAACEATPVIVTEQAACGGRQSLVNSVAAGPAGPCDSEDIRHTDGDHHDRQCRRSPGASADTHEKTDFPATGRQGNRRERVDA